MANSTPDLPVRESVYALLTPLGSPVYDMQVPKDMIIPDLYILLTSQTNRQHSTNKCGHLWATTILIDVVYQQSQGFSNRAPLDTLCSAINGVLDLNAGDIALTGFQVMNTQVLDTHDMGSLNTPTKTINRKLMRYQFIVMQTS